MRNPIRDGLLSLIVAVSGNLLLSGLFLNALLRPFENIDFIFKTGLWLFMVEFFSIFMSGMYFRREGASIWGRLRLLIKGFVPITVIGAMVVGFGFIILKSFYLPLIFFGSAVAKSFGRKSSHFETRTMLYLVLLLASTMFIFMVITPERLTAWFPFPEEVLIQKDPASSGEFVDRPQTLLVWGILYYILAALLETLLFFDVFSRIFPRWRTGSS